MILRSENKTFVLLTPAEESEANKLGHLKHDKSESDGRKADWYDGTERDNHAIGVGGEIAHSRLINVPFEFRIDTFKGPDVGENTEVRTTQSTWYSVKVKARDKDQRIVVGYRYHGNRLYEALGWLTVKEAKELGDYKDPGDRKKPAYFVAQKHLHPIETLPKNS